MKIDFQLSAAEVFLSQITNTEQAPPITVDDVIESIDDYVKESLLKKPIHSINPLQILQGRCKNIADVITVGSSVLALSIPAAFYKLYLENVPATTSSTVAFPRKSFKEFLTALSSVFKNQNDRPD